MALKLNNKPAVRYNPSLKVKTLGPYGARPATTPNYRGGPAIVRLPARGRGKKRVVKGGYGQKFNPTELAGGN